MKKLALILFMGTLVSFYADAGRKTLFWFEKGGSHTVRQAANLVCNDGSISASKKTCTN